MGSLVDAKTRLPEWVRHGRQPDSQNGQRHPGQAPGLSTFSLLELAVAPGGKAQVIDLDLLQWPLRGIEDDPSGGGHEGHISIAPVTKEGEVDQELLEEWANTRGTDRVHALTELVRNALVETNVRRPR